MRRTSILLAAPLPAIIRRKLCVACILRSELWLGVVRSNEKIRRGRLPRKQIQQNAKRQRPLAVAAELLSLMRSQAVPFAFLKNCFIRALVQSILHFCTLKVSSVLLDSCTSYQLPFGASRNSYHRSFYS